MTTVLALATLAVGCGAAPYSRSAAPSTNPAPSMTPAGPQGRFLASEPYEGEIYSRLPKRPSKQRVQVDSPVALGILGALMAAGGVAVAAGLWYAVDNIDEPGDASRDGWIAAATGGGLVAFVGILLPVLPLKISRRLSGVPSPRFTARGVQVEF